MSTLIRQPFAPLDGARLQTLTSIKNRQNAASSPSAKRKASDLNEDDFENVDPSIFAKRSKGAGDSFFSKEVLKAPVFNITNKPTARLAPTSPSRSLPASPRTRNILQPKSPISKINTSVSRSSPLSAPAGRSPTRSRRSGILSNTRRRTTAGSYSRIDPPNFNLGAAAPFSLDAALKGTIPSYAARTSTSSLSTRASAETTAQSPSSSATFDLGRTEMKASWFFDIHEDTPEQEMTNLLQHGTCTLDISSDEESEQRATRERAEGRDKENIPPADDVSQTSRRAAARRAAAEDDMQVEKERLALADLDASEYYATGCDAASVIIVPGDEDDNDVVEKNVVVTAEALPAVAPEFTEEKLTTPEPVPVTVNADFGPELSLEALEPLPTEDVDTLMAKSQDEPCAKAAVLQPIDGTGESFELWESASAKDDAEATPAAVAA